MADNIASTLLRVNIRNGKVLPNRDKSKKKDISDPFVHVKAFDHHGSSKKPIHKNYCWYFKSSVEWVAWENDWSWFRVQVWDEDDVYLEWLNYAYTYPLSSYFNKTMVKMEGFKGYIYFDYTFEP